MDSLEREIRDFIVYLDTLDYESGDNPILHISFFRSGNNRRKKMVENGSSFLSIDCSAIVRMPNDNNEYKMEHFRHSGEDILRAVKDTRKDVEDYIRKTYGVK